MASPEEQLSPLMRLGARLRELRTQAGLSAADLALAVPPHSGQQSKISRLEHGKQLPSEADIRAWAAACRLSDAATLALLDEQEQARVWRAMFGNRMEHGQEAVQKSYNELVAGSTLIRHMETVYVPGLLQVPGYAERVLREMITLHGLDIDDVGQAVGTRMARQAWLYDTTKQFEFLLAEPVLRYLLVTPEVMRAQLGRLETVIGMDRVRFGIVPLGVPLATTPQNSVQVYFEADGPRAVVETYAGETWAGPEETAQYNRALDLQWDDAAEGEAARAIIRAAADALPPS